MEHAVAKSYGHIHIALTSPFEKSKMISFPFSIMKNVVVLPYRPIFSVELICCIALGSASSACCLITIFEINTI